MSANPSLNPAADKPTDPALQKPRVRHPTSLHIPTELNKARSARGFPWRVAGYRIVLLMMKGEERISAGGVVLPAVAGTRGKDKEMTTGICIAHGAGEPVPHVGYISPEHDFGVTISDIVFIEPNSGVIVNDEENEYRVITPHDIVMVGRSDVGFETRAKLLDIAREAIHRFEHGPTPALEGMAPNPIQMPGRPDYEMEIGEAEEKLRKEAGAATKTQVSMAGAKKPAKEKG